MLLLLKWLLDGLPPEDELEHWASSLVVLECLRYEKNDVFFQCLAVLDWIAAAGHISFCEMKEI